MRSTSELISVLENFIDNFLRRPLNYAPNVEAVEAIFELIETFRNYLLDESLADCAVSPYHRFLSIKGFDAARFTTRSRLRQPDICESELIMKLKAFLKDYLHSGLRLPISEAQ